MADTTQGFGLMASIQKFMTTIRSNLQNVQQNMSVTRSSLMGNRSSTFGSVLTERQKTGGGAFGLGFLSKVPFFGRPANGNGNGNGNSDGTSTSQSLPGQQTLQVQNVSPSGAELMFR